MKRTLYWRVIELNDAQVIAAELGGSFNLLELRKNLFKEYEGNPVLDDAIEGRQSIEQSVRELGKKNRGIRKILPWRKDEAHNERLKYLDELVPGTKHLQTSGIFNPDNLITGVAEGIPSAFLLMHVVVKYLMSNMVVINPNLEPALYQHVVYGYQVVLPAAMSAVFGIAFAYAGNRPRFNSLLIKRAKYLDNIIESF